MLQKWRRPKHELYELDRQLEAIISIKMLGRPIYRINFCSKIYNFFFQMH